jgi:hypothetical protein
VTGPPRRWGEQPGSDRLSTADDRGWGDRVSGYDLYEDDFDSYGVDDFDDDWDPDDDPGGYCPDPTDQPDFEQREYERYMARLSPFGRAVNRLHCLRGLIWRHTWWRIKPNADEPPF